MHSRHCTSKVLKDGKGGGGGQDRDGTHATGWAPELTAGRNDAGARGTGDVGPNRVERTHTCAMSSEIRDPTSHSPLRLASHRHRGRARSDLARPRGHPVLPLLACPVFGNSSRRAITARRAIFGAHDYESSRQATTTRSGTGARDARVTRARGARRAARRTSNIAFRAFRLVRERRFAGRGGRSRRGRPRRDLSSSVVVH